MSRRCAGIWFLLGALVPLGAAAQPFEPTWESLAGVNAAPDWFRDAKIGIYFHWGVYSVPGHDSEWYPRNMFLPGQRAHRHHVETYGDPAAHDYAAFVAGFTAEHFDPAEWADLFARAGARFAGPVCEHHDGFAMWDSELTPWNAADMGPRRDITGELERAVRARGLRFVATFHHARNNLWEIEPGRWTGHYEGIKNHYPSLLEDPRRAILYGYLPRDAFLAMWLGKLREVIDGYHPDLIWFDSWLDEIPEATRREFLAYYYNDAARRGREVVVTRKQDDLPTTCSLVDYEKGRAADLTEDVWLTDDTISQGSWCWTRDLTLKDPDEVIDTLVDIVSKNGQLLLNISPTADGRIPRDQRDVLEALGAWLQANGEAIYETRPWLAYGEGPTRMTRGGHFVGSIRYGAEDIRYTRGKDGQTLYAVVLGNPDAETTLRGVRVVSAAPDAAVTRLADGAPVSFRINDAGQPVLETDPAPHPTAQWAVAYRLAGMVMERHEDALFAAGNVTRLTAAQATLEGQHIRVEERIGDRPNIGFWDDPAERVHWLLPVAEAGRYRIQLDYAAAAGSSRVTLQTPGGPVAATLPATGTWDRPSVLTLGDVPLDAGVHHVILAPADPAAWRAVNLWELRAARTGR